MAFPRKTIEERIVSNWSKLDIRDQSGKVFVVTGANSGIGYETSLALAEKGGTVVMACRDLSRSESSLATIKNRFPAAEISLMHLDLGSLESIRNFAKEFRKVFSQLDVLINNAGPVVADRILTTDGFESHFGVGHLGHFALTGQLMELLQKTSGSRVVTVGSRMHKNAEMNWGDLMNETSYDRTKAYSQGKLANMLFAFELSRKLEAAKSSTISLAAHPGLAKTNWESNLNGPMRIMAKLMSSLTYQSAEMGSFSILFAAVDKTVKNGGYYGPENDSKGYPVETQPADNALNTDDAQKLWELSEKLTGVQYKL